MAGLILLSDVTGTTRLRDLPAVTGATGQEFDKLYEQIRVMQPSPERTKIVERMQEILIEDSPYIGSMARYRFILVQPWLKNCKPTEQIFNTFKYLDIEG